MVIERRKFSPPQVARMMGVSTAKVVNWIREGELAAINVGDGPKNRPRYLVDRTALERFEAGRAVVPVGPSTGRVAPRRRAAGVKEYF